MVRLTDRLIFLPMSRVVLGLDCSVERVRTLSVDRTFSSAAARASWAFFSSLRGTTDTSGTVRRVGVGAARAGEHSLLEQRVLKLLRVELDPELVRTHPGRREQHRVPDEVGRRRPSARVGVDHQLKAVKR